MGGGWNVSFFTRFTTTNFPKNFPRAPFSARSYRIYNNYALSDVPRIRVLITVSRARGARTWTTILPLIAYRRARFLFHFSNLSVFPFSPFPHAVHVPFLFFLSDARAPSPGIRSDAFRFPFVYAPALIRRNNTRPTARCTLVNILS